MEDLNLYIIRLCRGDKNAASEFQSKVGMFFDEFIKNDKFINFSESLDELKNEDMKDVAYKYYLIAIDMYYKNQLKEGTNLKPEIDFHTYFPSIIIRALREKYTSPERLNIINKEVNKITVDKKMEELFGDNL